MTLRTKSRVQQGTAWLCAALVFLLVYVGLSHRLYQTVGWNSLDVRCHRLMLPLAVLFVLVARETRWDGIVRKGTKTVEATAELRDPNALGDCVLSSDPQHNDEETPSNARAIPQPSHSPQPATSTPNLDLPPAPAFSGEELFAQARALPHQPIPDFEFDAEYLELLGQSAATNYAPAQAKLGEYAMRRAAWVEAYFWMKLAMRNGMSGLPPTLRTTRQNWAADGFPDEAENENVLFPLEAGSIGRALLHLDSGQDAVAAREFLKTHHPNVL